MKDMEIKTENRYEYRKNTGKEETDDSTRFI